MRAIVVGLALPACSAAPAWADWNGDGRTDVLGASSAGRLLLYRGNGAGGWITGTGEPIGGGGWTFPALLFPGDFSGDGKPDLLAVDAGAKLLMYRGDGAGGWVTGTGETIGCCGWAAFTAVLTGGDFSGDGKPDAGAGVRRPAVPVSRQRLRRPAHRHGRADRHGSSHRLRHRTVSRRFRICG